MKLKQFIQNLRQNIEPLLAQDPDPEMTVYVMATDRRGNSVKIPVTEIWGADGEQGFDLYIEGDAVKAAKPIEMVRGEDGVFAAKL